MFVEVMLGRGVSLIGCEWSRILLVAVHILSLRLGHCESFVFGFNRGCLKYIGAEKLFLAIQAPLIQRVSTSEKMPTLLRDLSR
jgi:hypothetical protein